LQLTTRTWIYRYIVHDICSDLDVVVFICTSLLSFKIPLIKYHNRSNLSSCNTVVIIACIMKMFCCVNKKLHLYMNFWQFNFSLPNLSIVYWNLFFNRLSHCQHTKNVYCHHWASCLESGRGLESPKSIWSFILWSIVYRISQIEL
jgi:hypothetical protein